MSSNWSRSTHGKHLIFFITGIHPLLSELCSGKEPTLLIKRDFMSLKLMQIIRKDRGKTELLSQHLPEFEKLLNKHLQHPSLHLAFESHL